MRREKQTKGKDLLEAGAYPDKKDIPQGGRGGGMCFAGKRIDDGYGQMREEMKQDGICGSDIEAAIKEIKRLRCLT